jgi:shikimate kinase
MALCEKVFIIGFSGAGKSSLLMTIRDSAPQDWHHFDDLDQLILKNRGRGKYSTLSSLIENEGWERFRLWERQELEGWVKNEQKGVLSLGGGAFTPLIWELYQNSRKLQFCYLKASFATCWERLTQTDTEVRPLVLKGKQALEELYQEREKLYNQVEWQLENEKGCDLAKLAQVFLAKVL